MKQRILVVDDEAQVCNLLADFFGRYDYQVVTAATLGEAERLADDLPFELVILDIAFPEGDGLGTLEKIKGKHPNLPVVMLTGMGFDLDLMAEARQKKASGFLSKTLPLSQLLMEAHRVLNAHTGARTGTPTGGPGGAQGASA